jgi:hypothetical protein
MDTIAHFQALIVGRAGKEQDGLMPLAEPRVSRDNTRSKSIPRHTGHRAIKMKEILPEGKYKRQESSLWGGDRDHGRAGIFHGNN